MAKNYSELIKARLEQVTGAIAQSVKGLIYFRSDTNRPQLDDGTDVSQLMLEKHMPEARRATKVQLDDALTGNEILGVLPHQKGGTGVSDLTNFKGKALVVNDLETGFEFGESGGGSLDYFYTENFETTSAADLTVVGTDLTIADNAVTPISKDNSITATQTASTVVGDLVESDPIVLDENQKGTLVGFSGRYKYDGDDNDFDFVVYDITNDRELNRVRLPRADVVKTFKLLLNTDSTTASIKWQIEVMTVNSGKVIGFDNIEGKVNPLPTAEFVKVNSVKLEGNDGRAITAVTEDIQFNGTGEGWTSTGDTHYYTVQDNNSVIQISGMMRFTTSTNRSPNLALNTTDLYKRIATVNTASSSTLHKFEYTSKVGEFVKGDKLSIRVATNGGTLLTGDQYHYLNIVESQAQNNVVWEGDGDGVGEIVMQGAEQNQPRGTLYCDGSAVSRDSYSKLFAEIGTAYGVGDGSTTFNLPDMRGYFPRGFDDGAGVDSGRIFGSSQLDEFKSHTHTVYGGQYSLGGLQAYASMKSHIADGNKTSGAAGGTETRPKNIAFKFYIRYESNLVYAIPQDTIEPTITKVLSADVLTAQVMVFDTVIGQEYSVGGNALLALSGTQAPDIIFSSAAAGTGTLYAELGNIAGSSDQSLGINFTFTATSDTMYIYNSGNNYVRGNGTKSETFVQLTKRSKNALLHEGAIVNHKTSGEYKLPELWMGKQVYARSYELLSNITASSVVIDSIGLIDPIDWIAYYEDGSNKRYAVGGAVAGGTSAAWIYYNRIGLGNIESSVAGAYTLRAGTRFTIRYIK